MVLRALLSALLLIPSILFCLFGAVIALTTPSQPMRPLTASEVREVEAVSQFVEHHIAHNARMPTTDEFNSWAVKRWGDNYFFSYSASPSASLGNYEFRFWDGSCEVIWRPGMSVVEASADSYFIFGSKLHDVLGLFGTGLATFIAAIALLKEKQTNAR